MRNIAKVQPKNSKAKVVLFGSYGDGKEIVDPYYVRCCYSLDPGAVTSCQRAQR